MPPCPTATQCYVSGADGTDGDGAIVPITDDVVGLAQLNAAVDDMGAIECVTMTECIGGGSAESGDVGALVLYAVEPPAPTISYVAFTGSGTGVEMVVSGSGFGDWEPLRYPGTPITCVTGDTSYDFDSGVLGFTDVTGGWSAGTPGSCVGLTLVSWSDDQLILGLGSGYVFPTLNPGDSYQLTVGGTTYSGAAAVAPTKAPIVTGVSFETSKGNVDVTVTGSSFGSRIPLASGILNCVSGDTSRDYLNDAVSLSDETQGWTAGQSADCLGLVITKWSSSTIELHFGADYPDVVGLSDGDSYELDLLGTVTTGTATVAGLPAISSVAFSGVGSGLVVTVTGSAFGPKPGSPLSPACAHKDTGKLYSPSEFAFADQTSGWNAGQYGNCTGVELSEWSSTSVSFTFGNLYARYGIVQPGDTFTVTINGSTYSGVATLADPAVIGSVSFSGAGKGLTMQVSGSDFGPRPLNDGGPDCVANDPSKDFAVGVLGFADVSSGWAAGTNGDCIGLTVSAWSGTSITFRLGRDYSSFPPAAAGDTYQIVVMGTTYQSNAPSPL